MKPALIYYKENVFSQLDYFQNIRLATSGHTVDERFYLTFNDLSESYNKEGITAIFIMNTLSDNAIELQGLQMAHYIRIITRGEGVGKLPIFLIGSENITELLRLSDYSSILQTPAVELLPYSKEKVKNVIDNIHAYKHLENYEAYLKKTHIPQPNNYLSHHSITSEWSLYQWSKCLNIKSAIENHIEMNLYYRYVTSQHPECGDKVTIDYPPYPSESESEKKRILIIDDEADKGWGELYKALFSHYSNIEVNTLKGFDYASDTKEALLQKVKETIKEKKFEPYHLVLLDIRLLQNDFKKKTDFSSFDVINMLQTLDKGIQIIIVTASNKAWKVLDFSYNLAYTKTQGFEVLKYGTLEVKYMIRSTLLSLKELLTGGLGVKDLSGPVGVVDAIGSTYEASKSEGMLTIWVNMLYMAALLSANLGVMNLLPLPALDGGRLVFLIIEAIRRKPVNRQIEGMVHFAGLMVLMLLMVVVMYNDILKIF